VAGSSHHYILRPEPVELCPGRRRREIEVANVGDRPVQVGSHYHFVDVNPELRFERELAHGMRLDVPAGTAVRFEPGEVKAVTLVAFPEEWVGAATPGPGVRPHPGPLPGGEGT
jgi:urease beta subunit